MIKPFTPEDWTAALRSSEYEQGKDQLETIKDDGNSQHCCLGVLCDLAIRAGVDVKREVHYAKPTYNGSTILTPEAVLGWSGLKNIPIRINGKENRLDGHNDSGVDFEDIADAIDANTDKLFPLRGLK